MVHVADDAAFVALNIAVLTVSDTRTEETDTSGAALVEMLEAAGHKLADKAIVKDDIYQMREVVSRWVASSEVNVIISTGGTGYTLRDSTPEAMRPLFDTEIEGFGELFRTISYEEIGSSSVQSRALAGHANGTVIFCLPGSTRACRTGWNTLLQEQLDSRHKPCNFVAMVIKHRQQQEHA